MDYIIVGGGIYGCAVAWELTRRGAEVLLLEAKTIASGASGGLGKRGVRANGRDLRELPLMRLAYERWPSLHEEIGGPTGYERTGHLLLIERARDLASAPFVAWMQAQQQIPTHLLERGAVHELEPHLSDAVVGALHCPKDGVANHTGTTRSYAEAAARLGAEIRENTAVVALETHSGTFSAVVTDVGERIPVNQALLLLSNVSVPHLLEQSLGIKLPVWPLLPQVMLTQPLDRVPLRHLIGHAHRTLAMKPHDVDKSGRGQIMISGGWRGAWEEAAGKGRTRPDQVAGNLAEAVAVIPTLADVEVAEADAARVETASTDGIPIIDRLDNLFYAAGWSGHGWAIAPTVARLLADWAWSGERSALLRPFAYKRFLR